LTEPDTGSIIWISNMVSSMNSLYDDVKEMTFDEIYLDILIDQIHDLASRSVEDDGSTPS
tara:strand:- start:1054 stop:1233 length:180 start_codon:yes stop_codon:yes gene_type:complete